jgi:starch-binding outer membrane protein, SusD/RagB family
MKKIFFLLLMFALVGPGCKKMTDLDVPNENAPGSDIVLSATETFPALLSGAYNSYWNTAVSASPTFSLTNAEVITSGYASWSSFDYYKVPRTVVSNDLVDDVVLSPPAAAWYGFYGGIPTVNRIIKALTVDGKKVMVGNTDHTQNMLAHAYIIRGMLFGHLGLFYDKAFIVDELTDFDSYNYELSNYTDVVNFAVSSLDKGIAIVNTQQFTDPIQMLPNVTFDNVSLKALANSMAARILASSPRTAAQATQVDWNKVYTYASNGLQSDWGIQYKDGWNGKVISRDLLSNMQLYAWDWIRVHQRVINMMAPNHPNAVYPWPDGITTLGPVTSPDLRLNTYFRHVGRHTGWNPSTRGYNILSEYKYVRYETEANNLSGFFPHFLKAENDLLKAEAGLRTGKPTTEVATLINNTRVGKGGLPALTGSESTTELMNAIFYERYLESDIVYPHLSFFDRRRRGELRAGTLFHFPVPANELILHKKPFYTFGGIGNEM